VSDERSSYLHCEGYGISLVTLCGARELLRYIVSGKGDYKLHGASKGAF